MTYENSIEFQRLIKHMTELYTNSIVNYQKQTIITFGFGCLLLISTVFLRIEHGTIAQSRFIPQQLSSLEEGVRSLYNLSNENTEINELEAQLTILTQRINDLKFEIEHSNKIMSQYDNHLFYFMAIMSAILLLGSVVPGFFFRAKFGHELLQKLDLADRRRFADPTDEFDRR
ncbi:MAG: hypothetical protein ABJQ71_01165 [Roseibium sp.]